MPGEREEKVSLELTDEVLKSMEVGLVFRDYNGRISSMDFHRSEKFMVTASDDESIRLYDFQNAMWLKTINSKKYGVDLVSFTDHPTTVIYSSKNGWDESLRLLSLNDNKYLRYFKGHHDRVVSLSWCPWKDYFISGSLDRTVLLWDQRAEKSQGLLRVQGRPAVSYDDQGMVFAIAFGGYIRMFDTRMYEKGPFENFSVGGDFSEANVVKFSNDGRKMLLTTMGGHIHVLDSFRGTMISTFTVKPVSSNATLEASFSPDGAFVVSGYKRLLASFATLFFWFKGVPDGHRVICEILHKGEVSGFNLDTSHKADQPQQTCLHRNPLFSRKSDSGAQTWDISQRGSGDGCVYGCDVTRGTLAYLGKTDTEAPPIKWAPGSLLFATGSSELSFWIPDLSKLGAFGGMK